MDFDHFIKTIDNIKYLNKNCKSLQNYFKKIKLPTGEVDVFNFGVRSKFNLFCITLAQI
jgi:hypothetical protein